MLVTEFEYRTHQAANVSPILLAPLKNSDSTDWKLWRMFSNTTCLLAAISVSIFLFASACCFSEKQHLVHDFSAIQLSLLGAAPTCPGSAWRSIWYFFSSSWRSALAEQDIRAQRSSERLPAQELMALRQLEEKKYQIERQALQDKLALLRAEKVESQKIMDQMLLLEKQHALANKKIDTEIAANKHVVFENMRQSFQSVLSEFFKGAKSIGDTIRGLMVRYSTRSPTCSPDDGPTGGRRGGISSPAQICGAQADRARCCEGCLGCLPGGGGHSLRRPVFSPAAAALAYAATMAFWHQHERGQGV